ncbi:alpha-(1,3)-fucosyltransferase 10 [Diprion similis]|uniref:alpha-(1,3)-fucosyltransferase 10 n=1 Tax=Diprion similis TaxID=362088 RepID=UPI001EF8BBEA|nr:alpha-(1,3)-fucosyltransferase 10 [Diprion similis]XP_046752738.1 alpha-(1,3)-fucosyltransferase 10 [Diprion similis]XP_046752824.1 alpha-(1,3)-fucosyltransferase 10 [Diprion similis]XP_046752906.1 alpha-(1,3)-fucosyltransferase 10 [Diprion similis]
MANYLRKCIWVALVASSLFIISQFWLMRTYEDYEILFEDIKVPVILWWTPFTGNQGRLENCGQVKCYFTQNRNFVSHNLLSTILFYGSSIEFEDLPLPRRGSIDWGLLHEESPRNIPTLTSETALSLFNHSATFSRFSDVPLTLVDLDSEEDLIGTKYFVSLEKKNRLIREKQLAPFLYIQSNCETASMRDLYIKELMQYISIDSYGACLNNKKLPESLKRDHVSSLKDSEFLSLTSQYKFTLAFENAVCDDYITEKLWRPLMVGSVPVYYGSPSFKDWLPNKNSAVSVRDFAGPKELANFLLLLATDESRYREYISHKISRNLNERITNPRLRNALRNRDKSVPNEFGNYVQSFECLVCQRSFDNANSYIVNKEHYNCPLPVNPLTNTVDRSNFWVDEFIVGRCKAKLLAQLVLRNISIDRESFHQQLLTFNPERDC